MKLLTLEEMAEVLRWKPGTARNRISNKEPMPPYIKAGHRLLFPQHELENWVKLNLVSEEEEKQVRSRVSNKSKFNKGQ